MSDDVRFGEDITFISMVRESTNEGASFTPNWWKTQHKMSCRRLASRDERVRKTAKYPDYCEDLVETIAD